MTSADPSNLTPVKKRAYNAKRPCSAHSSRTGEPCRKPAIAGGTVCRTHGGAASAAKAKARKRLEEASDRLARQLLGIAEGAESEAVRLAAVKDALDRAGIQAKTAATVEVSVKPWETVMEGISRIVATPRDSQHTPAAIESGIVDPDTDNLSFESDDDVALDVEVVDPQADPSLGLEYSDLDFDVSGTPHPTRGPFVAPVDAGPPDEYQESALGGPLGPRGPAGNGLLPLADAVEVVASMKAEHAARLRAEAIRLREARRY